MAESVTRHWRACALAAGLIGLLGATVAQAQLRDPTRPPEQWMPGGDAEPTGGPVLQSVLLSPKRKIAVISGQALALGERYGDATLVRLTESEAVLRYDSKSGSESQTLKLFPSIGKRPASDSRNRHPDNRK